MGARETPLSRAQRPGIRAEPFASGTLSRIFDPASEFREAAINPSNFETLKSLSIKIGGQFCFMHRT
jgi:hypothetical protein